MVRGPNKKKLVRLSKADWAAAMWWYSRGYQCRELGKEFDVDFTTIALRARKINVGHRPTALEKCIKLTEMDKDLIAYHYWKGISSPQVAKLFGVDRTRVNQIATEKNVFPPRRTCNENAFDEIEDSMTDEAIPYWLGFILADGHIAYDNGTSSLCICLQERDRNHLVKFRHFMNSNAKISHNPCNNSCIIRITSKKVVEKLAEYGIWAEKSHNARCDSRFIYNLHFWRGLIDGDGCIGDYDTGAVLQLTGTKEVATSFRDYIAYRTGKQNKVREIPGCWETKIQGKIAAEMIQFLYEGATIYLDRKMEKAQDIMWKYDM